MYFVEMAVRSLSAGIQCGRTSLTIWPLLKWFDLAGPLTTEAEKQLMEAIIRQQNAYVRGISCR